jgi:hypothetical protein
MGLSLVACCFHALVLYSSGYIVMLLELVIPLTVILFLPIVCFFVVPSLLGRLRNRYQFLIRMHRLSCVLWLL